MILVATLGTQAQSAPCDTRRSDSIYHLLNERLAGMPVEKLRMESIRLHREAVGQGDAELMLASYNMWRQSYHLAHQRAPEEQWGFQVMHQVEGCVSMCQSGGQAYFNRQYDEAIRLLTACHECSQTAPELHRRRMAEGFAGVLALVGNPKTAIDVLRSHQQDFPGDLSPRALAALVVAQSRLGDPKGAAELARAALLQADATPTERFVLTLSMLGAYALSDDAEGAAWSFDLVRPHLTADRLNERSFQVLNHYLLASDRRSDWMELAPTFMQWIAAHPDTRLSLFASVHWFWSPEVAELPLDERWEQAKSLLSYDAMSFRSEATSFQSTSLLSDNDPVPPIQLHHGVPYPWLLLGAALLPFVAWAGIRVGRKRTPRRAGLAPNADPVVLEHLRREVSKMPNSRHALALLEQLQSASFAVPLEAIRKRYPEVVLSDTTAHVLSQSIRGISGKEIALLLDVSPGHIYNIRTQLKQSLGLGDRDFPQWFADEFGPTPKP